MLTEYNGINAVYPILLNRIKIPWEWSCKFILYDPTSVLEKIQ